MKPTLQYNATTWVNGKTGFTLIELLVVVSIIALLVSLLMPALARSRAIARQMLCQTQLKHWGLAFSLYSADNKNFFPHIDGLDRQKGSTSHSAADKADYYGWIDVLPPYLDETPWREHQPFQYPQKDTLFQCPSAKLAPEEYYKYYPQRNGYFSYAMNSCLELDQNCWRHPEDTNPPMPSFLKTTRIRTPAQVILLFDQLLNPLKGYGGKKINRTAGQHCGSYPKAFSARHARNRNELGGSVLFCDSHVEWKATVWQKHWPDNLEVPPRSDRNWYPYPAQ